MPARVFELRLLHHHFRGGLLAGEVGFFAANDAIKHLGETVAEKREAEWQHYSWNPQRDGHVLRQCSDFVHLREVAPSADEADERVRDAKNRGNSADRPTGTGTQ